MSVSVAGNIDCAKFLEIKERVANIWDDSGSISAEYIADVESALAIHDNQTARFKVLEDPDKDRALKIWWPDDCRDDDPTDCEDFCDVDGPVAGTQCVNYQLDECFGYSYGITEEMFRTSEMEESELEAVELLKASKAMDEKLNKKAIALFEAAAGVNTYTDQYDVVGTTTYVPPAAWNADLMGYLDMVAWMNKQKTTRVLSGTLLRQFMWKVGMESTDPTGASAAAKMASLGGAPYFDRMLDLQLGHKALYLYKPSSLVIVNQARNAGKNKGRTVNTETGPVYWDVMESKNIPGVIYDVFRKEICKDGDIKRSTRLQFRGLFASNPTGCDSNRTGVLKMRCGIAP